MAKDGGHERKSLCIQYRVNIQKALHYIGVMMNSPGSSMPRRTVFLAPKQWPCPDLTQWHTLLRRLAQQCCCISPPCMSMWKHEEGERGVVWSTARYPSRHFLQAHESAEAEERQVVAFLLLVVVLWLVPYSKRGVQQLITKTR